jgi:hypothetical protein
MERSVTTTRMPNANPSLLTTDPANVAARTYVLAVRLDVMRELARKLTEVYERQSGSPR